MADFFQDYSGGNDANNGTTFALRKLNNTVSLAAGDRNKLAKSPDPAALKTAAGVAVNATFTDESPNITLSAATTANVHLCDVVWTAKANITCATSATRKDGALAALITPATAFTTGVAAYAASVIGNYSAYDRISFWIRPSAAVAANVVRIRLCSDTLGVTAVDQFTIPYALVSGIYTPIVLTRTGGGALGAAIQSVSLEFLSDPGTTTFLLDNIVATHADGASHWKLIGQGMSGTSIDHVPIRSIDGVDLIVDYGVNTLASVTSKGYVGTSGTVAAQYREPLIMTTAQSSTANAGTSGNLISHSGGWDPATSMTTQNGITVVRTIPSLNFSFSTAYLNIERIYSVDSASPSFCTASLSSSTISDVGAINANNVLSIGATNGCTVTFSNVLFSCTNQGSLSSSGKLVGSGLKLYSCATGMQSGVRLIASGVDLRNCTTGITGANGGGTITLLQPNQKGCTTAITFNSIFSKYELLQPTGTGWVFSSGASAIGQGDAVVCTGMSSTGLSVSLNPNAWDTSLRFDSIDGDPNDQREYTNTGIIRMRDDSVWVGTGHTPTGNIWEIAPGSTATSTNPCRKLFMSSGSFAAGTYNIAVKTYRTNANVAGKIGVLGGYVAGVASDTFSSASAAAINTTETLTVSVTLSAAGPIALVFDAYFTSGSTGVVYIDEVTVT